MIYFIILYFHQANEFRPYQFVENKFVQESVTLSSLFFKALKPPL